MYGPDLNSQCTVSVKLSVRGAAVTRLVTSQRYSTPLSVDIAVNVYSLMALLPPLVKDESTRSLLRYHTTVPRGLPPLDVQVSKRVSLVRTTWPEV